MDCGKNSIGGMGRQAFLLLYNSYKWPLKRKDYLLWANPSLRFQAHLWNKNTNVASLRFAFWSLGLKHRLNNLGQKLCFPSSKKKLETR